MTSFRRRPRTSPRTVHVSTNFMPAGTLLMVGTFGDPQKEGSMAIFTTWDAAEEFAKGDPFVLNGVVRDWHIREWNEVLGGD